MNAHFHQTTAGVNSKQKIEFGHKILVMPILVLNLSFGDTQK